MHSGGFPSQVSAEYFYANNSEQSVIQTLTAYSAMREEYTQEPVAYGRPDDPYSIHQRRQNYILFFACKSGEIVDEDSQMVEHVANLLFNGYDRATFSILFP